jgi:hypothetical protein
MNPSPPDIPLTRPEYEAFVYSLPARFPAIQTSTLVVKMIASQQAEVVGALFFAEAVRLEVTEVVNFATNASRLTVTKCCAGTVTLLFALDGVVGIVRVAAKYCIGMCLIELTTSFFFFLV